MDFLDSPKMEDPILKLAERMLLGVALEEPALIEEIKNCLRRSGLEETNNFKILLDFVHEYYKVNKTIHIAKLINCIKSEADCRIVSDSCALVQDVTDKKKCIND
jgi:hypothetical protein